MKAVSCTMDFDAGLQRHLQKAELEYRAMVLPNGSCVNWLAPYCNTTDCLACFLRDLGFHISKIVDEEPWPGEVHRWVETTSGIVVYVNQNDLQGFVAKSH